MGNWVYFRDINYLVTSDRRIYQVSRYRSHPLRDRLYFYLGSKEVVEINPFKEKWLITKSLKKAKRVLGIDQDSAINWYTGRPY